jgi:hypothetical protein
MVNREGCVVRAAEFCHFYSWDFPSKTAAFCLFLPAVAAATRWMYLYIPDFLFYFFEKLLDDWGLGRSARLIISHMAKPKKNETLAHRGVHRLEGFSRYHQQTTTNLHCECVRAKMNKFDIDDFLFYSLFFKKLFTYSRQRNCKF